MQVSPNVRAVQVPDDNPMHPQFTTIYLVGRGQVFTVDSGEDMDRYRWMLRGYLAATEKAEIALSGITHHHIDHSANLGWLRDSFGVELYVHAEGRPLLGERLPQNGVHVLRDGDSIEVGGVRLAVLHTPGHSVDSVCYYLESEGVLFSGDTILGSTTTTIGDLGAYMASLRRLRGLPNLRMICPGHGPIIEDPLSYIDQYVAHREERERQILSVLREGGEVTSWEIMLRLYPEIDERLRRAADNNVRQHLAKLEAEGLVRAYPGVPKPKSEEQILKERAEEEERRSIIAKAREYEEQARRRMAYLQENPPLDEWEEMPRYELVR
ncbi:MAG TPA: MBL fold metallo-hydrolase [Dehalococcoidia bacterium]|nr:MBL fold metallo-hydrolase [Dehalococcoidia bacterium]